MRVCPRHSPRWNHQGVILDLAALRVNLWTAYCAVTARERGLPIALPTAPLTAVTATKKDSALRRQCRRHCARDAAIAKHVTRLQRWE